MASAGVARGVVMIARVARATMDWETKSEAGYFWNERLGKWEGPPGAPQNKKGLFVIGAAAYAEHHTTDILTLSYHLPDGRGVRRWRPGLPPPLDLFAWIVGGGAIEAHYGMFERLIIEHVASRLYGFPVPKPEQWYCSAATARVNAYTGALGNLGDVLGLSVRKNKDGKRLLDKFSVPRKPTKGDPRFWIAPADDPVDAEGLYAYCDEDVLTEMAASDAMPPMTEAEREFWLFDQECNHRGLAIDRAGVRDCLAILNQALERYGDEFRIITNGLNPTQLEALKGWLAARGVRAYSLDADALEALLKRSDLTSEVRRVLEIRDLIGSASVKKLFSMENMASSDDRLRNLMVHHGARTGRPTGEGAQPLNMPKDGPKLVTCSCGKPYAPKHDACPWCGATKPAEPRLQWRPDMADPVLDVMASRSLDLVEYYFGDAVHAIMGCVRSLFVGGEGHELLASDYTAIEAVVTAMLAGEQWRIDAFTAGEDIYLASAARITGGSVEAYKAYAAANGEHHPDRQKIGKVAELGLGFGGWINAWRNFDDSDNFTDAEVKGHILAWRDASPRIVELWGGQWRGKPWDGYAERYGFEGAAVNAIQYPEHTFDHAGIKFFMRGDALIVRLLSGRELTYHEPRLEPSTRDYAAPGELSITYSTWNSNAAYGAFGWVRMSTYGSRLTENIVQAIAHDILRFAILGLREAGFAVVLHVYDEIVAEVPERPATPPSVPDPQIAVFEAIMGRMAPWCAHWPVRAAGGWRGKRYRKA